MYSILSQILHFKQGVSDSHNNIIAKYFAATGKKIGFKPAGGINTVHDALVYYTIVKELLGDEWLNNELFRLGTSRLANLCLSEIVGEEVKFF